MIKKVIKSCNAFRQNDMMPIKWILKNDINIAIIHGSLLTFPNAIFQDYMVAQNQRTIRAQCFPLFSILLAMGNPKVDLFR
jgi:hypothetical protein